MSTPTRGADAPGPGGDALGPTRPPFLDGLLAWLNRRMAPEGVVIGADTPLFQDLVDSMRILELIAWTERETGRRIPDREMTMEHFRTPRRIAEVFGGRRP